MSAEKRLLEWLYDVHAMERQAEKTLVSQSRRLSNYPQIKAQFDGHLRETRRQVERLEICIIRRGGEVSVVRALTRRLFSFTQGLTPKFSGEDVIRFAILSNASTQMEIAAYRVLIAAAENAADLETMEVCRQILIEEQAMALWLDDNLDGLTGEYLRREDEKSSAAVR